MSLLFKIPTGDISDIKAKTDFLPPDPADESLLEDAIALNRSDLSGVYFNATTGVAGTAYPIGTTTVPVNNITDALAIAATRKLVKIYIENMPFGGVDLTQDIAAAQAVEFIGIGQDLSGIDINGHTVNNCIFRNMYVNSEAAGSLLVACRFHNCWVAPGAHGSIGNGCRFFDCFSSTFILADGAFIHVYNLRGNSAVIFTGSGSAYIYGLDAGGYLFIGNVGAANYVEISSMANSTIEIQDTCIGGDIQIYGDATIVDNSAGSTVVALTNQRALHSMDFWSAPQEEVQVTGGAGDKPLPSVTIADLPIGLNNLVLLAGAVIVRAIAMFKFRMVENSNAAANKLNGAQYIQVRSDAPGAWRNAIALVDDMFSLEAETREGGDVLVGSIDISVEVDEEDTYQFQWDEAVAEVGNIQFNDVQTGLRIWYRL